MIDGIEWIALLIIVLILLFFGPTKVPELARGIGRAWGEFRVALKQGERELADLDRERADATRKT